MKKRFLFFVFLLVICFNTTAFAADIPNSATAAPPAATEQAEAVQTQPPKPSIPAPVAVDKKNIDGTEYLIKTYEVAVDFDPESLVEHGYEKDGFLYAHQTTEKKANENKKTKEASEIVSVETQSKGLEEILKRLPSTMDYDKEDYTGIIALDTGSISTEVAGYTTKSWTVSTVQEYPGLMYADPSYVPQTASKDGQTLPLTDIKWVVTGTGLAGDTLVPTEYKATVTYSKKVSSQVPTGYVTSANYKGTVTKTTIDTVLYTLTYIGTPVYVPTPEPTAEPAPTSEPAPEKEPFNFPWGIVIGVLLFAAATGGGAFLFMYLKSQRGIQIFNEIDKEFICIGRQTVQPTKPVIDLNPFKDMIESKSFAFVLDKATTSKLFGRNIAVTLDDVTVKHMVKGHNEQYKFNLELGGILDVE